MNKRINELFEQAAKEFSAEHKYATFIVPNPLKEKFAELIVKECIDCAVWVGKTNPPQAEPPELVGILARRIQQHFGVEQ